MKNFIAVAAVAVLSGCAYNVTLIPRDTGKVSTGEILSRGIGAGTLTITIDDDTCTGTIAKVASSESFGFATTYGASRYGGAARAFTTFVQPGDESLKAIMSCASGKAVRCDITGRKGGGGGVCLDNSGIVYDALVAKK